MALKSVESQWLEYAAAIFQGVNPHPTQIRETRQAFYAGVYSMFCAMEEIGEPHIAEGEAEKYLEAVRAECVAFKNKIMRDYAEGN